MKSLIIKFWPILFIIAIWFVFSSPFFLKGLAPYPSYFQSSFFSPWSAYSVYEGPVLNNAMPDIITQIYPWRTFTIDSLKNFELPLWNPYSFAGTPHLANYQSAALFPLNILFLLPIPFIFSWSFLVLLQPLIAGLGMYIFIKSLKLSDAASVLASLAFMFCGFIVSWMGYGTLGYAIAFLPLSLWGVNKFIETRKFGYGLAISFSIVLSLFAGHFQTSIYFLLVLLAYIFYLSFIRKNIKDLYFLLIFYISGILISLVQVLPSLEFYFNSVREGIVRQIEVVPLMYLPTLFAPDFFGNPVTRNDWFGHYAEWNAYIGVIPLLFAIFGSLYAWAKDRRVLFFIGIGIISLLMAYDTPLNQLFFDLKLPFFSTSASSRIIVLFSFSVAVLSAFGLDYLIDNIRKISFRKMIIFLSFGLGILVVLWAIPSLEILEDSEKNLIARNNLVLPSLIFIAFAGLSFLLYIFRKSKFAVFLFLAGILAVTAFDLYRFSSKWMPFNPPDLAFKDVGVTNFYEENTKVGRYLADISAENSVYYKIQALNGYDPLYLERYGELVKYIELGRRESGERSVVKFPYNTERVDKAINLLGVTYIPQKRSDANQSWAFPINSYPADRFEIVYEDETYRVFKNRDEPARAFVVDSYIVRDDNKDILDTMFSEDIDLKSTVLLEKDPHIENIGSISADTEITNYENNSVNIEVESSAESLLVLTDNYYPGWKAYVNGKESEIYRSNYTFRSVVVPEGRSEIRFAYEPNSFKYGIVFAVLGVGVIVATYVFFRKKWNKRLT